MIGSIFDHETGEALADVQVTLEGTSAGIEVEGRTRLTDEGGHFAFPGLPPGTYVLRASFVGRLTRVDTLRIEPDADVRVAITLAVSPLDLEPIVVTVHRARRDPMHGFDERRLHNQGTFITRDEIEQRNPLRVSDILRSVPGARFERIGPTGSYIMRFESDCRPVIWVDGNRVFDPSWNGTPYGIDDLVPAEQVEAIEVYRGSGNVPIQFGPTSCGAVVIWTRPAVPGPPHTFRWRPVFIGLGLVGLGLLLVH